MSDPLGALCIVLHGHLPYVLHHGTHPHGEAWLYEAAAETYLPLLDVIGEAALHKARPALTIGLTPVLLEQLAHDRFKAGFVAYLNERVARAATDRREFEARNEPHFAAQATHWQAWYAKSLDQFERLRRDIPGAFAAAFSEGHVQVLTSNATHAYMPLLLNDEVCRAQMACGTRTSERHMGRACAGMWLPECAYRPTGERWKPAVLYDDARYRTGIEQFIAGAGVTHFFVDSHTVANAQALGTVKSGGRFDETSEAQLYWDQKRGWGSPLEPVGVASRPETPRCFAFARHPQVSEQVWSGTIGYPGNGAYLEFHRKHGEGGLRYHRITGARVPLSDKQPYVPGDTTSAVYQNAQHFVAIVKDVLGGHKHFTGRPGVCVAPFDAELFGHWWFEGVGFLREVILALANDGQVKLMTAAEALASHPPDKVVRLPEGSWGEQGDHSVWLNDRNRLDLGNRVPRRGPLPPAPPRAPVEGQSGRARDDGTRCPRVAPAPGQRLAVRHPHEGGRRLRHRALQPPRHALPAHDRDRRARRPRRHTRRGATGTSPGSRPARQRLPGDRLELVDALIGETMIQELLRLSDEAPDDSEPMFYVRAVRLGPRFEMDLDFFTQTQGGTHIQRWQVVAPHAYSWAIREHRTARVQVASDHPLLFAYYFPQHELYMSARPTDPARVVGDLYQQHVACVGDWVSFCRYLHPDPFRLLEGTHGRLAEGPEPVIRAYADALARLGVRHNTIRSPGPTWMQLARLDKPPSILLLGETWVVANHFEATRTAVEFLPTEE